MQSLATARHYSKSISASILYIWMIHTMSTETSGQWLKKVDWNNWLNGATAIITLSMNGKVTGSL